MMILDSFDELLTKIKTELDSEHMDESHVDLLFHKLRQNIELFVSENQFDVNVKREKLSEVSTLLSKYEREALEQRETIQEGLKKLNKGRHSLKEYNKNT